MKNMRAWRWALAAVIVAVGGTIGLADELAIQSFDGTGRLTFKEIDDTAFYRVEWASELGGPWTNFTGAAGAALDEITAKGSGIVTCSVSMCDSVLSFYRIVALTPPSGMALIPGGTNSGTDPDFGAYSLAVNSFRMDVTEVTKAHWSEVRQWAVTNMYSFDSLGYGKTANHPVHRIYWYDMVKWCNARSEKEGLPAVYTVNGAVYRRGQKDNVLQTSAAGYRLPTDLEWQYAARGGVSNRRYSWGDMIDHSRANYRGYPFKYTYDAGYEGYNLRYAISDQPYTSPVGSFSPNEYGLYDMEGNVSEWCFDWRSGYEGNSRVLNGGCWYSDASSCRIDSHTMSGPENRNYGIGFRTVLSPDQP